MKTETFLFKKDHTFEKCPNCKAVGKLRRSKPKNSFEKGTRFGFLGIYRCRECGWRGRKFSIKFRRISFKTILIYIFLMFATAVIVKFVIQKFAMK